MNLTPTDVTMHGCLGISADMLERAQVRRVDDVEASDLLGMKRERLAGVAYPYVNPTTGKVRTHRVRRDHPDIEGGKPKDKYLSPVNDRKVLFFSPGCAALLKDTSVILVVVEAEKSVLSVACAGERVGRSVLSVATGGCWGWRGRIGKTEDAAGVRVDVKGPLDDWDHIDMKGRTVVIAFDANAAANASVQAARRALSRELTQRGATVRIINLPVEAGVNGPDDYIGKHGPESFFALIDHAPPVAADVVIHRASDVPDERLEKQFGGRLVRGSGALVAGPGDGGKGMFAVSVCSAFTTGAPFPGETKRRLPVNVLICVTEDSMGRVKSRLRAAGADLSRVYFVEGPEVTRGGLTMPSPMMLDDDAGAMVRHAKQLDAKAMFLETVVEHFGDRSGKTRRSTNNEAEVRAALAPFRAVCATAGLFGLGAIHPRKSTDGGVDDSISGSAAFRNVARSVQHIYRDPDDDSDDPVRLLFTSKANYLAKRPSTLRFRIRSWDEQLGMPCQCHAEDCGHEGRLVWEEELVDDRKAEEIWQQIAEQKRARRDVAVENAEKFLNGLMQDGVIALTPKEIFKRASDEGISKAAVIRAKEELGLVSVKEGFPADVVAWKDGGI